MKRKMEAFTTRTILSCLSIDALALCILSGTASASLEYRGIGILPNGSESRLIYDTDLNITWLDYSKSPDNWYNQMDWVSNLIITYDGKTLNNWRMPTTVDGPGVISYDGSTSFGWNNTASEMGHLYYTELGNKAYYSVTGEYQADEGLLNTGPFDNLISGYYEYSYWSGSEALTSYGLDYAYYFLFSTGYAGGITYGQSGGQHCGQKWLGPGYALAVYEGDVAAVPIPGAVLLLGAGLIGIFGFGKKLKR